MMQNMNSNGIPVNKLGSGSVANMNGNNSNVFLQSTGQPSMPDNFIFQSVDPSLEEDDTDSDTAQGFSSASPSHDFLQNTANTGLKPGKKTKGRVKIKMEFIENKLRRYTTFSKRKTGIMKKAYELSTLTGTQVMLLVASETGHVYTFATRKLQPMITSESGKALIQTCLNSPDPPPGTQSGNSLEQRMNPSGYEETELSCSVEQEEQKTVETAAQLKPVFPVAPSVISVQQKIEPSESSSSTSKNSTMSSSSVPIVSTQVPSFILHTKEQLASSKNNTTSTSSNSNSPPTTNSQNNGNSSIPTLQIPLLLSQGTAISMFNPSGQRVGQAISVPQTTQSSQTQTVVKPPALSHVVSRLNTLSSSQTNNSGELNTPLPVSTPAALNIMPSMTPGIVMYHTPQGVVYATPTQNIQDRTIFNFPQSATAISMTPNEQNTGQQIITIPVPVSVAANSAIQLAPPPAAENSNKSGDTGQGKASPAKKSKK